jgi:transaldolase
MSVHEERDALSAAGVSGWLDRLDRLGLDVTDVFLTLDDDGLARFEASWQQFVEIVRSRLDQAR